MGNLEKPLTWGLTILLLGYLFVANCKCGEESTCELNNGFNIELEDGADEVTGDLDELEGDEVDSGEDAGEVEDEETAPEEVEPEAGEEAPESEAEETEEVEDEEVDAEDVEDVEE